MRTVRSVPTYGAILQGQVQGLGFRPHVYRLATAMRVTGTVANTAAGLEIVAQGPKARALLAELKRNPPPLAKITSVRVRRYKARPFRGFCIRRAVGEGRLGVDVLPDIALCPDCRRELTSVKDRRHGYPFINCTQCGPRYTIIESLPYDRPNTTMSEFRMCPECRAEYENPSDRRFHAQPDACWHCGPALTLLGPTGRRLPGDPVDQAAYMLAKGGIVAIKSLGGFQLACDATNLRAVNRLRRRKSRPTKPLALMCEQLATVRRLCQLSSEAAELLSSPAAPIVLLRKRKNPSLKLAPDMAPGNACLGVMLAYAPLHLVLMRRLRRILGRPPVLVMTSANRRNDPLVSSEQEMLSQLPGVADRILTHNRRVAHRCDDSVVLGTSPPVIVRRARGFAPQPLKLEFPFHVKRPVLAVGGEMRNCFALGFGSKVYLSPHIGDLTTKRAEEFFLETLAAYIAWTGIKPELIACDLHPDYLSTRIAERLSAQWGVRLVRVQHHHAHVAGVMAEHGIAGPVLGLAFDGTGYGTDGAVWGCEFILVRRGLEWERLGHLGYLYSTESGAEVPDPARIAAAYLIQSAEPGAVRSLGLGAEASSARLLLDAGRAVRTSSLGRLFDAVAAITGTCRRASFEGEAPVALEAAATGAEPGHYFNPRLIGHEQGRVVIDPAPLIGRVAAETLSGVPAEVVSSRFHNTVVRAAARLGLQLAAEHALDVALLSGGSFQNSLLRRGLVSILSRHGLTALHNQAVPLNDGGVALGQMVAAAACFR